MQFKGMFIFAEEGKSFEVIQSPFPAFKDEACIWF